MANRDGGGDTFGRDFGYLDKFLTNLQRHADTLPATRGAELKARVARQVEEWRVIKALVRGEMVPVDSGAAPSSDGAAPAATTDVGGAGGLTVGSLRSLGPILAKDSE